MPGGTTEVGGNTKLQHMMGFAALASPSPNIAANTTATTTITCNGALVGDLFDVQLQSHTAGLSVASAWCTTNNQVVLQWVNSSTGTISSTNFQAVILVTRFENANVAPIGTTPWLQAIV